MAGYREGHDNRPRLTQNAAKNDERGHKAQQTHPRAGMIGIVMIHRIVMIRRIVMIHRIVMIRRIVMIHRIVIIHTGFVPRRRASYNAP
jgi:hypothetical protein